MAAEVIHTFVSDVTVAKDGELTVTETLQVRAEGRDMRHGIYRDFPLTFRDAGGTLARGRFQACYACRATARPSRIIPSACTASFASMPAARTC